MYWFLAAVFGWAVLMTILWNKSRKEQKSLSGSLWYYTTYFIRKHGATIGFGAYDIFTLDSGINWYNVEQSGSGFKIIGPADPELIARLRALDKLFNSVGKNGPGDLDGLVLLKNIGLDVKQA